jgi:hypothetical protein
MTCGSDATPLQQLHIRLKISLSSRVYIVNRVYIVKALPIVITSRYTLLYDRAVRLSCTTALHDCNLEDRVPKREKSKRLQVVITEEQDSLLTKTAYQLSNPERLVSKSEVVRLGIEMLNRAVEEGSLSPDILKSLEEDA